MEIEFTGSYDRDIYQKTIRWIYKPKLSSVIFRVVTFVIFVVVYGIAIVQAIRSGELASPESARVFRHFVTLILFVYFVFAPYIAAHRKFSGLWKDPLTRRTYTGTVSSIGVIFDAMFEPITWDKFVKVNRNPEFIALLTASQTFVLLQRSFFKTEQDWKLVQSLVDTKVQEVIE